MRRQVSLLDDAALIAQAQRGNALALAQLLQRHYLYVKKYLITLSLDRDVADDLTQETMIRAVTRISQYSGKARFTSWLGAIATNVYLDAMRRRQREGRLEQSYVQQESLRPQGSDPPEGWDDMLQALRSVPRDVRLPIVLKHYHGYEYEEIARIMGIPTGTVKSRIYNGIRTLRRGLSGDEP